MAGDKKEVFFCVYMHKNKINGKMYIGQTCQKPEARWRKGDGYKENDHFYRAIKKYGWDNFEHIILYDHLTQDEANQIEKDLIEKYDTMNKDHGYNLCNGGWNHGPLTPEHIEKIRQSNLGKKRSPETCKKLSEIRKGQKASPAALESYRNMGLARRGFNHPRSKPVMCIETGAVYGSSGEAERAVEGSHARGIRAACRGEKGQQTSGGYHWRFLTEEEVNYYGRHR